MSALLTAPRIAGLASSCDGLRLFAAAGSRNRAPSTVMTRPRSQPAPVKSSATKLCSKPSRSAAAGVAAGGEQDPLHEVLLGQR
jgi:hypothetical protein